MVQRTSPISVRDAKSYTPLITLLELKGNSTKQVMCVQS